MTKISKFATLSAAVLIAGSAFTLASAADYGRSLGELAPQNGFVNSDGSPVKHVTGAYGYSVQAPLAGLTSADDASNGLRGRDLGEKAPISGYNN
jgi:hypothetical protein